MRERVCDVDVRLQRRWSRFSRWQQEGCAASRSPSERRAAQTQLMWSEGGI